MSPELHSAADLRDWAYSDNPEPQQDFDLLITGSGHERLFLKWAADDACPKKDYFLGCLYLFVGDAVRTDYQTNPKTEVAELLHVAESVADEAVREWLERSRRLIAEPDSFDYEFWCGGGHARNDR